jgi:hypothetical protein
VTVLNLLLLLPLLLAVVVVVETNSPRASQKEEGGRGSGEQTISVPTVRFVAFGTGGGLDSEFEGT